MNVVALVTCTGLAWLGLTLLLDALPLVRRRGLAERLGRYAADPAAARRAAAPSGLAALRSITAGWGTPIRLRWGALAAPPIEIRLARAGLADDVAAFRRRQLTGSVATLLASSLLVSATGPPFWATAVLLVGAPLVGAAVPGILLDQRAARRREQLFHELPVIVEHLGTLIGNGYSIGAAVQRLARRTDGVVAEDLARVAQRVRQGTTERDALDAWAQISGLPEIRRLAAVLLLDQQGVDLGRLLGLEARAARQEAQRRAIETIERRTQLVWIPVTVAALLPGMLLLAVPFLAALDELTVP